MRSEGGEAVSPCSDWCVRGCRCAWIVAVLGVVILSLRPLPPGMDLYGGDKTVHLVTYMVLAAGFPWPLTGRRSLVLCAFLVLLGIILEIAQHLMDIGRSGETADALANGVGVFLGGAVRIFKKISCRGLR
ncbi:VanZ family protein [Desulfoplanes sp.]